MKNDKFLDIFSDDPLGLLNISSVESHTEKTPADKKLIESFEEINNFYECNNREPKVSADISEFMLASRLQGIRNNPKKVKVLLPFDFYDLLNCEQSKSITVEQILGDDPLNLLASDGDNSIFKPRLFLHLF